MKSFILILSLVVAAKLITVAQPLPVTSCSEESGQTNLEYSKGPQIKKALSALLNAGIPGVSMAVYSEEGWWATADGYARIEDRTPMQTCHLMYLQSISKTYMAVAVLKLAEQGKINLDEPLTAYLPEKYSRYISDAEKITVRMLLNHTSGIPEYNLTPDYVSVLLQDRGHYFEPEDYLRSIAKKPLTFAPGTKYSYRNTNYVILALMTDALTGDHSRFIQETIFKPLGLTHTYYRNMEGYLNYPKLVNGYWDRYSDGIIENASVLERDNVLTLVGDDGIVTTPVDAVKFLRGVIEGQLLNTTTLAMMESWVNDKNGNPTYGLGLDYTLFNGHKAHGHSGGGIGAGCQLYYFPEEKVYFFAGINLGTVTDSPIHTAAGKALEDLYDAMLK